MRAKSSARIARSRKNQTDLIQREPHSIFISSKKKPAFPFENAGFFSFGAEGIIAAWKVSFQFTKNDILIRFFAIFQMQNGKTSTTLSLYKK